MWRQKLTMARLMCLSLCFLKMASPTWKSPYQMPLLLCQPLKSRKRLSSAVQARIYQWPKYSGGQVFRPPTIKVSPRRAFRSTGVAGVGRYLCCFLRGIGTTGTGWGVHFAHPRALGLGLNGSHESGSCARSCVDWRGTSKAGSHMEYPKEVQQHPF